MTPWALVIGIDQHPDSPQLNTLHGAVADAADFAEWVLDPQGGGVAHERLFFWAFPSAETSAGPLLRAYLKTPTPWPMHRRANETYLPSITRAPVVGEIAALVGLLRRKANAASTLRGEQSRCYVHLAGHGVEIKNETCFLMGDFQSYPGMVSCDQMHRALQSGGFNEVLMFLDCCRTQPSGLTKLPDVFDDTEVRTLLGIGRAAETKAQSFEFPDPAPSRGAFTYALTQGLRSHRREGRLSFSDLGEFVRQQVAPLVAPRRQLPQFSTEPPQPPAPLIVLQGDDIEVVRDIVITFGRTPPGQSVVLTDFQGNPVGDPIVSGPEPVRVPAPIGRLYAVGGVPFMHAGPGDTHVPA